MRLDYSVTRRCLASSSFRPRATLTYQADFFVGAGNTISLPRFSPALCHSHPHWQRTESHKRGFFRSALHMAHDLIHMAFSLFTHILLCRLKQDRFTLSIPACSATSPSFPFARKAGALMFCFSCLIVHRTDRVGNGPEVWGSVRCEMAPPCSKASRWAIFDKLRWL